MSSLSARFPVLGHSTDTKGLYGWFAGDFHLILVTNHGGMAGSCHLSLAKAISMGLKSGL